MKKVLSYSLGWDTNAKVGYITLNLEGQKTHAFGKLGIDEFRIVSDILRQDSVYLDHQQWIISGNDLSHKAKV
ncbi:MAG: hypothetical protein ACRCVT_01705 [Leadbetterella sp.]